jgi:hypothetical protein
MTTATPPVQMPRPDLWELTALASASVSSCDMAGLNNGGPYG